MSKLVVTFFMSIIFMLLIEFFTLFRMSQIFILYQPGLLSSNTFDYLFTYLFIFLIL